MRHKKRINKLGRTYSHRKSMLANLASSLILNEYIVTTQARAKACKSFVDKVLFCAQGGDLHSRRKVERLLKDKIAAKKVFEVLVKRFGQRAGGYTYVVKLSRRKGDNAKIAKLILVGSEPVRSKKTKKTKKSVKAKKQEQKKSEKTTSQKPVVQPPKRSLLDRVKALRGKFGAERGKDQTAMGGKDVQAKSRSGI